MMWLPVLFLTHTKLGSEYRQLFLDPVENQVTVQMSTLKTGDTGEYNRITAYWEKNTEEPETAETFKLIDELLEAQCE